MGVKKLIMLEETDVEILDWLREKRATSASAVVRWLLRDFWERKTRAVERSVPTTTYKEKPPYREKATPLVPRDLDEPYEDITVVPMD